MPAAEDPLTTDCLASSSVAPLAFDSQGRPVTSVLFACTYNGIRSPMAEALLRWKAGRRLYVDSVGVKLGDIDPFVVAVMAEWGLDLQTHQCKTFEQLDDASFDLIITLSPEAQHRAVELTRTRACEVEYWKTLDPTAVPGNREARLEAFRQVRDGILHRLIQRFPGLAAGSVEKYSAPE